jgi:uncharacterized protein YoxC
MAEEKLSEESKKVAEALKILQKEADNTMETFSPFIAKITKASAELTGFAKVASVGLDAIKKYEMGLYSVTRTLNLTATGVEKFNRTVDALARSTSNYSKSQLAELAAAFETSRTKFSMTDQAAQEFLKTLVQFPHDADKMAQSVESITKEFPSMATAMKESSMSTLEYAVMIKDRGVDVASSFQRMSEASRGHMNKTIQNVSPLSNTIKRVSNEIENTMMVITKPIQGVLGAMGGGAAGAGLIGSAIAIFSVIKGFSAILLVATKKTASALGTEIPVQANKTVNALGQLEQAALGAAGSMSGAGVPGMIPGGGGKGRAGGRIATGWNARIAEGNLTYGQRLKRWGAGKWGRVSTAGIARGGMAAKAVGWAGKAAGWVGKGAGYLGRAAGGVGGLVGGIAGDWIMGMGEGKKGPASTAAVVGGAGLKGAAIGAGIGSIIPGIGTAIGAGIGGLIGVVAGISKEVKAVNGSMKEVNKSFDNAANKLERMITSLNNQVAIMGQLSAISKAQAEFGKETLESKENMGKFSKTMVEDAKMERDAAESLKNIYEKELDIARKNVAESRKRGDDAEKQKGFTESMFSIAQKYGEAQTTYFAARKKMQDGVNIAHDTEIDKLNLIEQKLETQIATYTALKAGPDRITAAYAEQYRVLRDIGKEIDSKIAKQRELAKDPKMRAQAEAEINRLELDRAKNVQKMAQAYDYQRRTYEEMFTTMAMNMPTGSYLMPAGVSEYAAMGPAFMPGYGPRTSAGFGTREAQERGLYRDFGGQRTGWEQSIGDIMRGTTFKIELGRDGKGFMSPMEVSADLAKGVQRGTY